MAVFSGMLFFTLPSTGQDGNFIAFFGVFLLLFLSTGLGSGSTFQVIAVIFRKLTMESVKAAGGSDEKAMREAATDTAAALGFISAIGASRWLLYPESLWYITGDDWLTGWSNESLFTVLCCMRRYHMADIWTQNKMTTTINVVILARVYPRALCI